MTTETLFAFISYLVQVSNALTTVNGKSTSEGNGCGTSNGGKYEATMNTTSIRLYYLSVISDIKSKGDNAK